jgi:hypothetical protein
MSPPPDPASADEITIAQSGPAVFANRIFVTATQGLARIAFTEQGLPGTIPVFRNAVVLSVSDAIALRDLLTRIIEAPITDQA